MFANPRRIVAQLKLEPHMKVADLGCGTGAYTLAAAPRVTNGHVYAVEIQKGMLGIIKNEAHKKNLTNIEYILGDTEVLGGTKIADHTIDIVFACNIFFQIENKDIFIKEIIRILKKGGKLLLVDWNESYGGMGPVKNMVINKDRAYELLKAKGFQILSDIDAGIHHYGIIALYK